MKKIILTFCLPVFLLHSAAMAQTGNSGLKKDMDEIVMKQAMLFIDNGKPDEAITMLKTLQKKYPANPEYPYEIAYARYVKKQYPQSVAILEKLVQQPGAFGRMYHLLGNCYDILGDRNKAVDTYEKGMELFPHTGALYLEMGIISQAKKELYNAMWYYERGIEADPMFASNYYRASKLYFTSIEKVWGMIYGEIFLNLERNTQRTAEISKWMYETYRTQIQLVNDTGIVLNFSQNAWIDGPGLKKDTGVKKIPFGTGVYQPLLKTAIAGEKNIGLEALCRIRTRFLDQYFKTETYLSYPNALFDYQYKVFKAGQLDAYNHWILLDEQNPEFKKWIAANASQWDKFMSWFRDNTISLDDKYKFYRKQY